MPPRKIVRGQHISAEKIQRAKELRQEMTTQERQLWEAVRGNRLAGFHFRRQQVIYGYIVDFYCPAARLVVEIDGPIHVQQAEYDQEKDRLLGEHGLMVIRIQNDAVDMDFGKALKQIEAVCRENTASTKKKK